MNIIKKTMRTKNILIISHRLDVMPLKYLRSSPWAASTFIWVSVTFPSILQFIKYTSKHGSCIISCIDIHNNRQLLKYTHSQAAILFQPSCGGGVKAKQMAVCPYTHVTNHNPTGRLWFVTCVYGHSATGPVRGAREVCVCVCVCARVCAEPVVDAWLAT